MSSNFEEVRENEALIVLTHAEAVLMKRIRDMKDGKPKYAASERLNELRTAMKVLKDYDKGGVEQADNNIK
jgi:hypothetical protein